MKYITVDKAGTRLKDGDCIAGHIRKGEFYYRDCNDRSIFTTSLPDSNQFQQAMKPHWFNCRIIRC